MEILKASHEWATRPDDQRYLTLSELKQAVSQRKQESWTAENRVSRLRILPSEDEQSIFVQVNDTARGIDRILNPTHWGFSQLCSFAQAPASYLRKLPAMLSSINLQWGIERAPVRDNTLILAQSSTDNYLRAMTSTSYGRIWDLEVVEAVERVNHNNIWQVPAASYSTRNPKRATTLYASDRDIFIFLVDPSHPVEVNGEILFRGFMVWNSEVGSSTFGLTTFLYRYICDNRIVWGATNIRELKIKHTGGAPERFAYEGQRYLKTYSEESTKGIEETVKKAQAIEVKEAEKEDKGWQSWLQARGFTSVQSKEAVKTAIQEEGEARSLWNIINGITAMARGIKHTDERVKVETLAGNLLKNIKD